MNHPFQNPHCVYWSDGTDVPVFQRPREFDALLQLFDARQPRRILEIGTYYGGTLKQWLGRSQPGTVVVSVDRYDIPRADHRASYAAWAAPGVECVVIAGDSTDPSTVAAVQALAPFDWIIIDADHYYGPAKADYTHYSALCAPGGVVILHDIVSDHRHPEIEVKRLWAEITATERTAEFVEDYAAAWGGLGVVYR